MHDSFSSRHRIAELRSEDWIRDDVPDAVRVGLITAAQNARIGWRALSTLLHKLDRSVAPSMSSRAPICKATRELKWNRFFDFLELVVAYAKQEDVVHGTTSAVQLENELNQLLLLECIGWRIQDGRVYSRFSDATESVLDKATIALELKGRQVSLQELREAIADLSRRPIPELTGAVQHAIAALECVARDVTGGKETLGDLIRRTPGLIPKPLDNAIEKMWGWASNFGRHLNEGDAPSEAEVELIVGIACALCTYLAAKMKT